MRVSEHFSFAETHKSQVATRHDIDNVPLVELMPKLSAVAENILEPVRNYFGVPFSPSSWYRCLDLNRVLKSGDNSQHVRAEAVDFEIPGVSNLEVAEWVSANLEFDQLILEHYHPSDPTSGWVHCSYVHGANRNMVLTINSKGVHPGLWNGSDATK